MGTATFSAGTVSGSYRAVVNTESGKVTVSGSTISAAKYAIYNTGTANTTSAAAVKVTSGTIESTENVSIYNDGTGLVYLTGGTIKQAGASSAVVNNSTGKIQISGATVTKSGTSGHIINNVSTGTIAVTSGTVKSTDRTAIYNTSTGTITVSGGNISGTNGIFNGAGGKITVSGGTITAITGQGIRVYTGTLTISGTPTIKAVTYGVSTTEGTATIKGGTIEVTGGPGAHTTTGTLTIGIKEETTPQVSTTQPSITGSTVGVQKTSSSGTINFYDGVIKGPSGKSISGTVADVQDGYEIIKNAETIDGVMREIAYLG